MSRAGMFVASIIAVALIGLGIWQFMPQAEEAEEPGGGTTAGGAQTAEFTPPAAGPVTVTASAAHRGDLVKRITANGVAEAEKLLQVVAEVGAKIRRIPVVEGQWVEAGELLVELDDTELQLQRDRAADILYSNLMIFATNQIDIEGQGTVSSSNSGASDENALAFLERYVNDQAFASMLRQPNMRERLSELTREDLFAALANLTSQRVALDQAELDLVRTRIVAPFAGQVAGLEATSGPNSKTWPVVGQQVANGTGLMLLVDPNPIRVRVEVIESEISFVQSGRRAEVTFQAFPGEVFFGNIEAIDPVVDAERKTLSVTVRLPNGDRRLKPGMFAQVSLDSEILGERLLVPLEAVLLRDNRQLVFVVNDGRAQWEYVTTGHENEEWIEILSDNIEEGDVIVTGGHFTLAHDTPVNIAEPAQPDGDN